MMKKCIAMGFLFVLGVFCTSTFASATSYGSGRILRDSNPSPSPMSVVAEKSVGEEAVIPEKTENEKMTEEIPGTTAPQNAEEAVEEEGSETMAESGNEMIQNCMPACEAEPCCEPCDPCYNPCQTYCTPCRRHHHWGFHRWHRRQARRSCCCTSCGYNSCCCEAPACSDGCGGNSYGNYRYETHHSGCNCNH